MNGAGRGGVGTDRNAKVDLPSSDPVQVYLHFCGTAPSLFHPDFGLTLTGCKGSETSNGDISSETINLLGEFEDLPRLKGFVFAPVRSGIA